MREKEWRCQKLKTSNLERQGGISRVREWKKICRNSLEGEISSWRWTLLHKGRSILWESRSEVKGQRDSEGEGVRGINCSFKNLEIMKKNKKNSWKEKKKIICFSEKMERSKGHESNWKMEWTKWTSGGRNYFSDLESRLMEVSQSKVLFTYNTQQTLSKQVSLCGAVKP